ncbi:MAG: hypothetical protein DRJ03_02840 [Chloroflexi bacterium]|nr:MAG: hypothetical protein DRJ03_02840 [Chloroflexota bacterium]
MSENKRKWLEKSAAENRIYRIFSKPPHSEKKRNKTDRLRKKFESQALQIAKELDVTSREYEMTLIKLEESYQWARRAVERHG